MPVTRIPTPSAWLTAFQTSKQRESLVSNDASAIEHANPEALQEAIRASLADQDNGLTEAQRFARESADPDTMATADDEALALGIMQSLEDPASAATTPRASVPGDEISEQRGLIEKLMRFLQKHGFDIRPNSGMSNNCLIIAMLQHATGDYASEHAAKAQHYKRLLCEHSAGSEQPNRPLFSDNVLTEWLIDQINHDHFGERKEAYLKFQFVTADLAGRPAVRTIGNGARVAGIVDMAGHYEAFTPRVAR